MSSGYDPDEPRLYPGQLIQNVNLAQGGDWVARAYVTDQISPRSPDGFEPSLTTTCIYDLLPALQVPGDPETFWHDLQEHIDSEADNYALPADFAARHMIGAYLMFAEGNHILFCDLVEDPLRWPEREGFIIYAPKQKPSAYIGVLRARTSSKPGDWQYSAAAYYRIAGSQHISLITETELAIQDDCNKPWLAQKDLFEVGVLEDGFDALSRALTIAAAKHNAVEPILAMNARGVRDSELKRYLPDGTALVSIRDERDWQLLKASMDRRWPDDSSARRFLGKVGGADLDKFRVRHLRDTPGSD